MRKLTFDELVIETTRRCNMSPVCQHCSRGDPQPVDLSFEDIDALLNQTEQIYDLQFTGGEALCNVPALEYILAQLKQRGIHLWSMSIFTNGLAPSETIIGIVKSYADYIDECRRTDGVETQKALTMVHISRDRYHSHSDTVNKKIAELQVALQDNAAVIRNNIGEKTVAAGNAIKNLDRSKLLEIPQGRINRQQIAVHDAAHKPTCMLYESFPLRRPDQTIVCCPVYVTARGNLISSDIGGMAEYAVCDAPVNTICHVSNPSFYDAIFEYNTDKYDCLDRYIFYMIDAGNAERTKFIEEFFERETEQNYRAYQEERPEDQSIFPIPSSISDLEHKILTMPGAASQEEQIRVANEIRARIRNWDGISVPSDKETYRRALVADSRIYANLFKRLGVEEAIQRDVNAYMERRKAQEQAEATQKRIDAVKAKVDSDMAAIRAIWAARAAKE